MKYTGETCQVCGETFTDSDNIVVCPECGTPVHRECWDKNGKCINEEKHGEYVWTPSSLEPLHKNDPEPDSKVSKLCPFCSARNDENALTCTNCGNPLINEDGQQSFHERFAQPNFQNTFDNEQSIDGVKVSKIAKFVQVNFNTYIRKFTKISQKKLSFNWAAAFFNPYWFFFRKLYYVGGIFLGLQLLVTIVSMFLISRFGLESLMQQYLEATSMEAMQEIVLQMQPHLWQFVILSGISILPNIIAGFIGDIVYKKTAFKKIKKIETLPDSDNVITYAKNGGGVALLAAVLSYVGYNILTYLFL